MAKEKSKIYQYLIISGTIYAYSLLFSLLSFIFLSDTIMDLISVIMGCIFFLPVFMLIFITGRSNGEKTFKLNASLQADKNSNVYKAVKMNYLEVVFSLLPFAVPLIILTILGVALKNNFIHAIPFFVFMPASLVFSSIGVITLDPVGIWSLVIYILSTFIVCGAYVLGYFLKVRKLINERRDIASELRMFNN